MTVEVNASQRPNKFRRDRAGARPPGPCPGPESASRCHRCNQVMPGNARTSRRPRRARGRRRCRPGGSGWRGCWCCCTCRWRWSWPSTTASCRPARGARTRPASSSRAPGRRRSAPRTPTGCRRPRRTTSSTSTTSCGGSSPTERYGDGDPSPDWDKTRQKGGKIGHGTVVVRS